MLKKRFQKYLFLFSLTVFIFAYGRNETKPNFSFGIIADVQYCECVPLGTRFYSNSLNKLEESIRDLNAKDMSFVIQLGDLIDRDMDSYEPVERHRTQRTS